MTLRSANRVDPWGRIFSDPERGYLMGNRVFGDAWIACSLRNPDGTTSPYTVRYFKMAFLDEPTAYGAIHPAAFLGILASNASHICSVRPAEWRP